MLFGFWPGNKKYGSFWDWTTLAIKKCLQKYYTPEMTLLDMGTGPYSVLSIYSKKTLKGKTIFACDHNSDLIKNAQEQYKIEGIEYVISDLFKELKDNYDCIIFNAPYIDENFGKEIGVLKNDLAKNRWSGGIGGTVIIDRFVQGVDNKLTEHGLCLLGVNHFHVKNDIILEIIKKNKKIELVDYYNNKLTKSAIYILQLKNN
jgi:methylase of polypeptide subunit release factors